MTGIGAAQVPPTTPSPGTRAVFIDKDGTLVHDVPYNVDPALLQFTPNALAGLRLLQDEGYALVVVTNQPGLAMGRFDRAALARLQAALTRLLADAGIALRGFYACPHAPSNAPRAAGCLCRKPAPGLLRQAAKAHAIELGRSWMIGDILDDIEAGRRAGCRTVLLDVGSETVWRRSPLRTPHSVQPDLLQAARHIVAADAVAPAADAAGNKPGSVPPAASAADDVGSTMRRWWRAAAPATLRWAVP